MKWKTFKQRIKNEAPPSTQFYVNKKDGSARMLFRGQADFKWKLESTLERAGYPSMNLRRYMGYCESTRRFLGNLLPCDIEFDKGATIEAGEKIPNYEYAAFLRHHGFPSPLLDWSESPYVAAFFAFRAVLDGVKKVRIYGYRSHGRHGRSFEPAKPTLYSHGPFATVHERHAIQQCWYTWCVKKVEPVELEDKKAKFLDQHPNDDFEICPHEQGLPEEANEDGMSDSFFKWDIDATERELVMGELFQMNITPFSLFRNADSAVETAAMRLFNQFRGKS